MGISSRQHSIKGEGGTTENWLSIKWQWEGNHKNIIKPIWGISGKFLPRHRDQNLPNSSPHSPQVVYNDRSLNWGYAFKTTASVNGLSCKTMDGWYVHPNFFFSICFNSVFQRICDRMLTDTWHQKLCHNNWKNHGTEDCDNVCYVNKLLMFQICL